jgi:hypothetical protein
MADESEIKGEYTGLLIFLAIAVLWYAVRPYLAAGIGLPESYVVKKGAVMEIIIISLIILAGSYLIWHSRYISDQFIADGIHGSIIGSPTPIGPWAVFRLGVAYNPIYIPGDCVAVVPRCNVYRVGHNYVAGTKVRKTPDSFLPVIVSRELFREKSKYALDNVYFGRFDNQFIMEHKNENIEELQEMLENSQAGSNMRDRHIEGNDDLLSEKMHLGKELNGAPGAIEKIFGGKKPEAPQ